MVEIDRSSRFQKALAELETATLKLHKPFDEDQALEGMREAVYQYEQVQRRCASRLTPAQRREHYAGLLKVVRTARRGYEKLINKAELIDPLVWALEEPDWDGVEEDVNDVVAWFKTQEGFLKKAHAEAKAVDGRSQSARYPELDILVSMLAHAWEKQTQEDAGRSRPSITPEVRSTGDLKPTGPFVRFVEFVVDEANLETRSKNLPEYVDLVLDRRDWDQARVRRKPLLMDRFEALGAKMQ